MTIRFSIHVPTVDTNYHFLLEIYFFHENLVISVVDYFRTGKQRELTMGTTEILRWLESFTHETVNMKANYLKETLTTSKTLIFYSNWR